MQAWAPFRLSGSRSIGGPLVTPVDAGVRAGMDAQVTTSEPGALPDGVDAGRGGEGGGADERPFMAGRCGGRVGPRRAAPSATPQHAAGTTARQRRVRCRTRAEAVITMTLTTRSLAGSTWDAFAELVEHNNGIDGGCCCLVHHPMANVA